MSHTWYWATGAFVLVLAATLVPGAVGFLVLAPLASLAAGGVAAWLRVRGDHAPLGQAVSTATGVGLGALVGSVCAALLIGFVLGSDPVVQELVRASEPHPEARLPYAWIAPLAATLGGFAGLALGLFDLALAALGGVLGGLAAGARPTRPLREAIG
jgi:hypothetical protein